MRGHLGTICHRSTDMGPARDVPAPPSARGVLNGFAALPRGPRPQQVAASRVGRFRERGYIEVVVSRLFANTFVSFAQR